MRIGVVGLGRIGTLHARILAGLPEVGSMVVHDVDPERADQVSEELGVQAVADAAELLEEVEAVVITTATSAHAELVHLAAEAGVATFCEKPISLDLESTRQVVEHVERSGTVLQMGFQRRFDPGYRAAHDLLQGGGLGILYVVRMAGHDPEPPHESYIPASGGIFRDFSVHDFDALRFVTGREVVEVYADGGVIAFPVFEKYGDVDTAVAILRLAGGALGILSVTRHDPLGYDIRMELLGSGDSVVVGWDERVPIRSLEPGAPPPAGPAYRNFQERFQAAYQAELAAFLDVALGRRANPCTAQDAYQALRVAVACDLSRAERRPVSLEEVA